MKLVMLEGIDRIGKTTLIKRLDNTLRKDGKDVILDLHRTPWIPQVPMNQKPHCYEYTNVFMFPYFLEMLQLFKDRDIIMLMDRFYVTGLVYGIVKRPDIVRQVYGSLEYHRTVFDQFEDQLMQILGAENVILLQFCLDKVEHGDSETSAHTMAAVNDQYRLQFANCKLQNKHLLETQTITTYGGTDVINHHHKIINIINNEK